jgi:hypothetical protein
LNVPAGNDFTAVDAGHHFGCALRRDGSLACWGNNHNGELNAPAGNDFTAVSAGSVWACALRSNGDIRCWGGNAFDPLVGGFTSVSVGQLFACGRRNDGSIDCWGNNSSGQATPPRGIGFSAVSAGGHAACALRSYGPIICWGSNGRGQLNVPRPEWRVGSVSPTSGTPGGGTHITITGHGFVPGDQVLIGQGDGPVGDAVEATGVDVVSATQITATTGAGKPGTWSAWVVKPDGSFAKSSNTFTYGPKVTSITPTSGPAAGGTQVTITGLGFVAGDRVVIGQGDGAGTGAIPATVHVDSLTQITATTGAGKPGKWKLFVIGHDNATSHAPEPFTYTR